METLKWLIIIGVIGAGMMFGLIPVLALVAFVWLIGWMVKEL